VKGYTLITSWHRDGRRTHHVELWAQPTGRYLVARVYHWYGMWICHSWLARPMERVYNWRHRHADVLSYLSAAQDVRSYELGDGADGGWPASTCRPTRTPPSSRAGTATAAPTAVTGELRLPQ
jgi:hypothetical protein